MNQPVQTPKDRYIPAVLTLCALMILFILFVLFGGVRALYAVVQSSHVNTLTDSDAQEGSSSAIIIPDSAQDSIQRGYMISPIRSTNDLRDEVFLHKLYSGWTKSDENHMQGACTDGTTIWVGWSVPHLLMKFDISTRKINIFRYKDDEWVFGHINDMTYNPNTNKLYIASYDLNDSKTSGNLAVLDASTLEYEETLSLTHQGERLSFHGIAYDRIHDQYILATSGEQYTFLDSNFQFVNSISVMRYESDTLQGIETDGEHIFRCLWRDNDRNLISVYDLSGAFLRLIEVPVSGKDTELQDIMYDWKGNWYINTADYDRRNNLAGASFYYVGLLNGIDYHRAEQFLSMIQNFLTPNFNH